MFFNPNFRRTSPPMNMPFYQGSNNMQAPQSFLPNLMNPERPFAEEMKNENNLQKSYISNELESFLQQFMQDEKNASSYYERLAEKTEIEKNKKILYSISKNALEEINFAKKACNSLSIKAIEPQEKSINTIVTFSGGIALALEEEGNGLNKLSQMLDNENSEINERLTPFVLRKLSRINSLYLIHYNL